MPSVHDAFHKILMRALPTASPFPISKARTGLMSVSPISAKSEPEGVPGHSGSVVVRLLRA
jgi:hypothetical protein